MTYLIDIQRVCTHKIPVTDQELQSWATLALINRKNSAELTLRLVDVQEITQLNHTYRSYNKPTNVLAFPSELPEYITLDYPFLGDVVICAEVMEQESRDLGCSLKAHWAHIVLHGVLHLLGYDHISSDDASIMQAIEIELLHHLGFDNPYHANKDHTIE